MTSTKGVQLSATVPLNIVVALHLLPGTTYTVQLQDGESARFFVGESANAGPPDIATVEAAPTGTDASPRPLRLENDAAVELTPGVGPKFLPVWAWDAGAGVLAVIETA